VKKAMDGSKRQRMLLFSHRENNLQTTTFLYPNPLINQMIFSKRTAKLRVHFSASNIQIQNL
jgi:hypothetical protein